MTYWSKAWEMANYLHRIGKLEDSKFMISILKAHGVDPVRYPTERQRLWIDIFWDRFGGPIQSAEAVAEAEPVRPPKRSIFANPIEPLEVECA